LRTQAARSACSLLVLASLPLFGDMFAVRAGFVVRVDVGDEVAKEDLSRGTAVVRSEGSSAQNKQTSSELAKSYEAWFATGDGPSKPGPMPCGPQAPSENQGCQGTGGGTATAGSSVQAAGLPTLPVVIGPDLAMQLFAREADLQVEQISRRLFRPPRQL